MAQAAVQCVDRLNRSDIALPIQRLHDLPALKLVTRPNMEKVCQLYQLKLQSEVLVPSQHNGFVEMSFSVIVFHVYCSLMMRFV